MKKSSLALLALAAFFAVDPAARADEWAYSIDGSNFSADLTLFTTPTVAGVATVQSMQGTFQISGESAVTFGETSTENAVTAANPNPSANSLTLSSDGEFLFDNLIYTTATGNNILDWGGLLVDVGGYELNIFSGAFGGSDGTYAPGNTYFYFADNGAYHYDDPISKNDAASVAATATLSEVPEPGSLFLLGTGLFGLALALHRRDMKTPSRKALNA